MENKTIDITDSEWKVMQILWSSNEPMTLGDIIKNLPTENDWNKRTVQTLVQRLSKKEALGYEDGRFFKYYPLISEEHCQKKEVTTLLNRIFRSSPTKLVATLVDSEEISNDEIDEIVQLLEEIKRKNENES